MYSSPVSDASSPTGFPQWPSETEASGLLCWEKWNVYLSLVSTNDKVHFWHASSKAYLLNSLKRILWKSKYLGRLHSEACLLPGFFSHPAAPRVDFWVHYHLISRSVSCQWWEKTKPLTNSWPFCLLQSKSKSRIDGYVLNPLSSLAHCNLSDQLT